MRVTSQLDKRKLTCHVPLVPKKQGEDPQNLLVRVFLQSTTDRPLKLV